MLTERNLTIKQVTEDTGLSRNTVSNLVNKPMGNISVDTTDLLCNYLRVTPKEFFEYSPYRIEAETSSEVFSNAVDGKAPYEIAVTFEGERRIYYFDFSFEKNETDLDSRLQSDYHAELTSINDFGSKVYEILSVRLQTLLNDRLTEILAALSFQRAQNETESDEIRVKLALIISDRKQIDLGSQILVLK
nr:helix-turn-helix transcriptional regulator [Lacticaseibacillus parakribbianus]